MMEIVTFILYIFYHNTEKQTGACEIPFSLPRCVVRLLKNHERASTQQIFAERQF